MFVLLANIPERHNADNLKGRPHRATRERRSFKVRFENLGAEGLDLHKNLEPKLFFMEPTVPRAETAKRSQRSLWDSSSLGRATPLLFKGDQI